MKTAVEWIEQQLIDGTMRPVEIIAIAKQMEKEQIFNSYEAGFKDEYFEPNEYYNETYGNENS